MRFRFWRVDFRDIVLIRVSLKGSGEGEAHTGVEQKRQRREGRLRLIE